MEEYRPGFVHKNKTYTRIAYDVFKKEIMKPMTSAYFWGQNVRCSIHDTILNNELDDFFLCLSSDSLVTKGYRSLYPKSATLDTIVGNTIGMFGIPLAFVVGFFSEYTK